MNSEQFHFVLFQPAVPGNIGASARAMKTMGFSKLRLVKPADHLSDEARMMAHASGEILENAAVFDDFDRATADLDFIITTTAKTSRTAKQDFIDSREIASIMEEKGAQAGKIGVVFGSEESGLPNYIVLASNLAVTVPMAGSYPSLNLSQSVMVMAYELSRCFVGASDPDPAAETNPQSWSALESRVISILKIIGIPEGSPLHHRIRERMSLLGSDDINLVHSVSSRVSQHLTLHS